MFRQGQVGGHAAVWLENELLRLTILPEKGADIYEFSHKPSGVDFMMRTPAGLQPPGEKPQAEFLDNYEGAWQELFPNTGGPCEYRGEMLPMHGEVALLPWTYQIEQDDESGTAIRFTVRCEQTPFRLERLMRLKTGESTVEMEGRVTNEGDEAAHFVWGHHVVLGGDFLEHGCLIDTPAGIVETPAAPYEPAMARLLPGQHNAWPFAQGRNPDEQIDLRQVPGPDMQSHDDAFLTSLAHGEVNVTNPRLKLRFTLKWDARLFRTLILWQPYGGPARAPLTGAYGLGIEPWISGGNLEHAITRGEALLLAPGEQVATRLFASVAVLS